MSIPTPACTPAPRPDPDPRAASRPGAGRPMDRTGGMENAHDTLAADCTRVEAARFPPRLGRHRTPSIRSTGKIVVLFEHDVTDWISNTRRGTDGRKPTEERRCAPTSVHVRRNPCSRSPDSAFNFTGIRIYGVLSYAVSQRRRELGVRMALGAGRADVVLLVVRQGGMLVAAGCVLGLLAAAAATRVVESVLFGVTATDGLTFAGVTAVVLAAGLLACWLPARWATRIDPMEVLRFE